MKANEIIKEIMKKQGMTQQKMGEALGRDEYSAQQYFGSKIRTQNMTVNSILEILDILDGELIIRTKEDEYKVTSGEVDPNKKYRNK